MFSGIRAIMVAHRASTSGGPSLASLRLVLGSSLQTLGTHDLGYCEHILQYVTGTSKGSQTLTGPVQNHLFEEKVKCFMVLNTLTIRMSWNPDQHVVSHVSNNLLNKRTLNSSRPVSVTTTARTLHMTVRIARETKRQNLLICSWSLNLQPSQTSQS